MAKHLDILNDHQSDLMSALVVIELIEEEAIGTGSVYLANLIRLGKMALEGKLEVLERLLSSTEGGRHE